MKHLFKIVTLFSLVYLSGCSLHHPQSAEEFRKLLPGSTFGEVEKFVVNQPLHKIGKAFKQKAPECLNVSIRTVSQTNMSYQVYTTTYKPTVKVTPKKVELYLQQHMDNVLKVSKEPEGGYYMMVVDVEPVNKKKSQVTIYRSSIGNELIIKSIKRWANGKTRGCPDLTKN